MLEYPDAAVVVLRETQHLVPQFHQYVARLRARGRVVKRGDQLIVYRVDSTVPEGPVRVTDTTHFVFTSN